MKKRACEWPICPDSFERRRRKTNERALVNRDEEHSFFFIIHFPVCLFYIQRMKFRLKLHPSNYSITLEDFDEDLTIEQLKNNIKKRYLSLRKSVTIDE